MRQLYYKVEKELLQNRAASRYLSYFLIHYFDICNEFSVVRQDPLHFDAIMNRTHYEPISVTWTNHETDGSSRPEVFCKKVVFRNFAKFTGKDLCQSLFLK